MLKRSVLASLTVTALLLVFVACDNGTIPAAHADEYVVAELVNDHRQSEGLSPLRWTNEVFAVARAHSDDMHDRDFFSHTNPDNEDLANGGVVYAVAGENIAWGYASPEAVVQGWLGSPDHRANIENSSFTHHGVGYVADGPYWTHVFIRPGD